MCGITALFAREKPLAESALNRATAVLRHRGPDCQRHWHLADGHVGLGHARLSIIDLTGGGRWPLTEPTTAKLHTTRSCN